MITEITALYAIADDMLKAMGHKEDCRTQMSDAEVITAALITQVAGYEKEDKTEYRNQKIDKPRIPKSKESLYLLGLLRKRKIQF